MRRGRQTAPARVVDLLAGITWRPLCGIRLPVVDLAAREALSGFLRSELRTELAGDLDRIFTELEELRLRFNIVERLIGIPPGSPQAPAYASTKPSGCAPKAAR